MHQTVIEDELNKIGIHKLEFESGPPPYMCIQFTDGSHVTISYDPTLKDLLLQTGHIGLSDLRIAIPKILSYQKVIGTTKMQKCPYWKQQVQSVHVDGHGFEPYLVDICCHESNDSKMIDPDECFGCNL